MSSTTLRVLIGLFLIAHGWIHYSLTAVPLPKPGEMRTPFWPAFKREAVDGHWLAVQLGMTSSAVRLVGCALWVATVAGFCLGGLALIAFPGSVLLWEGSLIFGGTASMLLLVFYWHPWLVMGPAINLAVFAALALRFPASIFNA